MTDKHPTLEGYTPGTHWATDQAFEIMDTLPVGALPPHYRFWIAGNIAGALFLVREGKEPARSFVGKTQHTYPESYAPGAHWASDAAWAILDMLPVNMLSLFHRDLIAGMIAGALMAEHKRGKAGR